jgi:hypothetical protein
MLNNLGKAPLDGVLLGMCWGRPVKVTVSSAGALYDNISVTSLLELELAILT